MSNDIAPNPRRVQFLAEVNDRLDAFALSLLTVGLSDAEARRQSMESQFHTAIQSMDDFELEQDGLPLLSRMMRAVLDSLEVHDVRAHIFSDGNRSERCAQCRYGRGILQDGIAVNRRPHTFNRHLCDGKGLTRRHQVAKDKELVIVRHETQSSGPASKPLCAVSQDLGEVISAGECQLAMKASAAESQAEREDAISRLADASWKQDVGVKRDRHERLMTDFQRPYGDGENHVAPWERVKVSNDLPESVWKVIGVAEDDSRRDALKQLQTERPDDYAWLLTYIESKGKVSHSLRERQKALTIRRWLDRKIKLV
ncbi:MAG: hypothetical protein WCC04_05725 [Terriglobales bacterium]